MTETKAPIALPALAEKMPGTFRSELWGVLDANYQYIATDLTREVAAFIVDAVNRHGRIKDVDRYLAERSAAITKQLADSEWHPRRAHIEGARNAMNKARADLSQDEG